MRNTLYGITVGFQWFECLTWLSPAGSISAGYYTYTFRGFIIGNLHFLSFILFMFATNVVPIIIQYYASTFSNAYFSPRDGRDAHEQCVWYTYVQRIYSEKRKNGTISILNAHYYYLRVRARLAFIIQTKKLWFTDYLSFARRKRIFSYDRKTKKNRRQVLSKNVTLPSERLL